MNEVIKTIIGFILSAAVVAYLYPSALEMSFTLVPSVVLIPVFVVICLLIPFTALPIYLIVINRLGYSYKTVVLSSVLAIIVTSVWVVFPFGMEKAVVGQKVLVESGQITLVGYQYAFAQLFLIALVGVVGGSVFYGVKSICRKS